MGPSRRLPAHIELGWRQHGPIAFTSKDQNVVPIVDTYYTGGFGSLEFVPASRMAYNASDDWAVAIEEYGDFGPLGHFEPLNNLVPRSLGRDGS